jgi:hypothetical protein
LSAVYGRNDFGNETYSNARDRILDAMAADIAAQSEINLPEKPKIPDSLQDANPNETRWQRDLLDYEHRYAASMQASLPIGPLELSTRFELEPDVVAIGAARTTMAAFADALEVEPRRSPRNIALRKRPALKSAMLAASLCAVVVIGGSTALLLLKNSNLPTDWSGMAPKSDNFDVAVQSLQKPSGGQLQATVQSLQKPSHAQLLAAQNEPTPGASVGTSAVMSPSASQVELRPLSQPTPEKIADLVRRGRELFAAGKVRDARILLKRAAEAGDASAALVLATTYDPADLEKLQARDADPDIAMARAWYQKAKDLASTPDRRFPQNSDR